MCGGFNYCDVSGGPTCEAMEASQVPIDTRTLYWGPGCFYFHKSWVSFIFWYFGLNVIPNNFIHL